MLTYLAIAAKKRLGILKYQDRVTGTLGKLNGAQRAGSRR